MADGAKALEGLQQFKPAQIARLSALRPVRSSAGGGGPARVNEPLPQTEEECMLARTISATVARTKFGSHLTVRNWHATPEFCAPSAGVVDLLQTATREKSGKLFSEAKRSGINPLLHNPDKWLFLDTETTGISGGTGTYAFLIGIAWWDSGGLQVEQFLMRDFSEEHSVLHELAGRLAERPVLVTFNGKTFDWPLLESRYQMTRSIRVPQLAGHLDLLHPARAVWKLRLGSVKLTELEKYVLDAKRLGWDRADDVPSNMIPQLYFDYLRGRSVAPLAGVVRHNRNDLRGLAALFGKLNQLLSSEECEEEADGLDLFGLSRYFERRGERRRAETACSTARERGLPIAYDALARWELAKMLKRRGEHDRAADIWKELTRDEDWKVAACEALATYYERQKRDAGTALKHTRQAIIAVRKSLAAQRNGGAVDRDWRTFERLGRKIARLELRLRKGEAVAPLLQRL